MVNPMSKTPTHKWIVAAVCESEADMPQIITHIENDTNEKILMYESLEKKSFKYELKFLPIPIPVDRLMRRDLDGDNYFDVCIGTHVRAGIKSFPDYWGLTLLLNRDLLIKYGLDAKFVQIVKHNYFKRSSYDNHVICCFGGTPEAGMRCSEPSTKTCEAFAGCNQCKDTNVLISCKHTCYHYFICLTLLDTWPRDRKKNVIIDYEQFKPPVPHIY
jgi:hypothetical protein